MFGSDMGKKLSALTFVSKPTAEKITHRAPSGLGRRRRRGREFVREVGVERRTLRDRGVERESLSVLGFGFGLPTGELEEVAEHLLHGRVLRVKLRGRAEELDARVEPVGPVE